MNTVNDLRQALSDEVRRLQPPAGLEARVLQHALRSSATVAPEHFDTPGHAGRSADSRSVQAPRLMALVAAVLAVAIVVGLVLAARALHPKSSVPAHPGPPPTALPANGLIAVAANPTWVYGGRNGDIYLVSQSSEPGPTRRIIGSDYDGVAQECPEFSPDGRWLAYGEARASGVVSTFRGVWPVSDRAVVVVGLDDYGDPTTPIMRVKLPTDSGEIACPRWSPSGRQVAFRVGSELWVADASSGKTTVFPVTEAPFGQQGFAWSRDGALIAVAEPGQIRVVPMDGGASTVIPTAKGATPGSLGWTAGDDRIIYTSTGTAGNGLAIHAIGVGGNNDTRLTPTSADLVLGFYKTVVSPDGTRVAYVQSTSRCTSDGCAEVSQRLLAMGTDGSNVVELPIPSGMGLGWLQWSPDGKRLLTVSTLGLASVAVTPGSPAVVYPTGLNLEWSVSEVSWQPVFP